MWQGFVLGLMIGGNLGFLFACVCRLAARADRDEEATVEITRKDRASQRGLYLVPPEP